MPLRTRQLLGITHSVATVTGAAFLFAWMFTAHLSPSLMISPISSNVETSYFASLFGATGASIILCLIAPRPKFTVSYTAMPILACMLSLLTLAESLVSSLPDNTLSMAVLGLLDGMCQPLLIVAWGARFSLESKRLPIVVFASYAVAVTLYFGISFLHPHVTSLLITVALPLASALLWCLDLRSRRRSAPELDSRWISRSGNESLGEMIAGLFSLRLLPWQLLLVLALTTFLGDFIASIMLQSSYDLSSGVAVYGFLACLLFCLVCIVSGLMHSPRVPIEAIARFLLPIVVLGMVSALVFGADHLTGAAGIIRASGLFFGALALQLVVVATKSEGLSPLRSFSLVCAFVNAIEFLGHIAGLSFYVLFGLDQQPINLVIGTSIVLIIILALFAPNQLHAPTKESPALKLLAESEQTVLHNAEDDSAKADFDEKVERFARRHKLSSRETEIIALLLHGRSGPKIAEMLFVTSGTIKTHLKHIYAKLGANGRQDTIDLFDAFE